MKPTDHTALMQLLTRYAHGQCTAEEIAWVESWYLQQPPIPLDTPIEEFEQDLDEIEWRLKQYVRSRIRRTRRRMVAIASVVILILSAGYFLFSLPSKMTPANSVIAIADRAPGSDRAILTLADGSVISLDSVPIGHRFIQNTTTIIKTGEGKLVYKDAPGGKASENYNTITTPRGGRYQLVLPDGSHVWLNAASTLTYPVAFAGDQREVDLAGEAYFEIRHNKNKPFHVHTGRQDIEVLGTHFNVMGYDDEKNTTTTLLEGAIKVSYDKKVALLDPGQQSITKNDAIEVISKTDVEKTVAWKDGWFEFDNTSLPVIMRQLSRWYNIDPVYKTKLGNEVFGGRISKNLPLSKVLALLRNNGAKIRIEDGKLVAY